MGLLSSAKKWLGFGGADDADDADHEASAPKDASPDNRSPPASAAATGVDPRLKAAERAGKLDPRRRDKRPPLKEDAPPPGRSVDDALAEWEAGRKDEARKIFAEIDKGGGLRTVLRAAAALDCGDRDTLNELLPKVAAEEPSYRLLVQVASALTDRTKAARLLERATAANAPAWALGWALALSPNGAERRKGLVSLLFADPQLARTVAHRDLQLPGTEVDPDALSRYAAFAHGRDAIRRFGAEIVADLLDLTPTHGGA